MVSISFDVHKLNSIIADANKKNVAPTREYTKTSFLNEGKHTVRFFLDPENNITREAGMHQAKGKKCLCPDWLNKKNAHNPKWAETVQAMCPEYKEKKLTKLPECEICKIAKEVDDYRANLSVRYNQMVYVNLYETNKPSEYWVPDKENGTPYVVIGNSKLKTTLMSALENIAAKSPEFVVNLINPSRPSVAAVLEVVKGTSGYVNITILPYGDYPAIIDAKEDKAPEWWRPFNEVFISNQFNVDAYNEFVIFAEEKAAELEKNPLPEEEDADSKPDLAGAAAVGAASSKPKPQDVSSDAMALSRSGGEVGSVAPTEVIEKVAAEHPELVADAVEAANASTDGSQVTGELAADQRRTKMGRVVTLPDYAVARNCWTKFNEISDDQCMLCPANLECMTEGTK